MDEWQVDGLKMMTMFATNLSFIVWSLLILSCVNWTGGTAAQEEIGHAVAGVCHRFIVTF